MNQKFIGLEKFIVLLFLLCSILLIQLKELLCDLNERVVGGISINNARRSDNNCFFLINIFLLGDFTVHAPLERPLY